MDTAPSGNKSRRLWLLLIAILIFLPLMIFIGMSMMPAIPDHTTDAPTGTIVAFLAAT